MKSNNGRIVLNSLWILLDIPGFLFGCLTGVGMFLAGKKVGVQRWKTAGVIYFAVLLLLEIAAFTANKQSTDRIISYYLVIYFISVVHSIVILVKFIPLMKNELEGRSGVTSPVRTTNETTGQITRDFTVSKDLYSVANSAAPEKKERISFDNSYYDNLNLTASAINTQTPTKVETAKKKAEIIDINTCTERDLASLPGVSIVAAKKAIAYRDKNNGFASEQEFYKVAGIQLHFVKQIKDKIYCGNEFIEAPQIVDSQEEATVASESSTEIDTAPAKEKKGRVLDI